MEVYMDIKLENLAKSLFDDIKSNKKFFETKYVIVPSPKMEAFLKAYYLKNNDSVLMNVKIMTFNKAILELFGIDYSIADRNQIRSIIIKYLDNNKTKISDQEVKNYLSSDNYEIKVFDVASELTSLFSDFEKDNELSKLEEWQKKIYEYINNINNKKVDEENVFINKLHEGYAVVISDYVSKKTNEYSAECTAEAIRKHPEKILISNSLLYLNM